MLLDFGCAGLDRSSLLSMPPCLCFNTSFFFFFFTLFGKELQGHGSIYVAPNRAGKTQLKVVPKQNHAVLLLNVTGLSYKVHQNQLCENILDELRFAFTDDAGQGRLL